MPCSPIPLLTPCPMSSARPQSRSSPTLENFDPFATHPFTSCVEVLPTAPPPLSTGMPTLHPSSPRTIVNDGDFGGEPHVKSLSRVGDAVPGHLAQAATLSPSGSVYQPPLASVLPQTPSSTGSSTPSAISSDLYPIHSIGSSMPITSPSESHSPPMLVPSRQTSRTPELADILKKKRGKPFASATPPAPSPTASIKHSHDANIRIHHKQF
ncbi:hypothetical protein AX16_001400 [Volvariella volvacea WC 439]|nr:hypothetical protein AX16_001400 [Volvariella volvacea WC 439]